MGGEGGGEGREGRNERWEKGESFPSCSHRLAPPKVTPQNAADWHSAPPLRSVAGPHGDLVWFCLSPPPPLALPAGPAQLPGSPAAPTLLSLLSSTLSGLARLFALLLRRPPPEAPLRRRDFSALIPALPAAGFSPGHEERPGRLSLLLRAALVLPGRPPGGRLPREVDASAGQSSPILVSTVVSSQPAISPGRQYPGFLPNSD